jgi:hypothetical protein
MRRRAFIDMKASRIAASQEPRHVSMPRAHQCRRPARKIRRLVHEALAARGGIGHMTLDDWRDMEQELNRRLQSAK